MKFSFQSKFSILHFFIFQSFVPTGPALKKFQCMIVKLPEVNFFSSKIHIGYFSVFQKHSNFKNSRNTISKRKYLNHNKIGELQTLRPNLQWEKEYRYFIMVGISVFVGRGQKKIEVYDCKALRCYFFSLKFCIGFFPVFQKGQNFKNYRDTIS